MNIHEYQAKRILSSYGVKTLRGFVINSIEEADRQARLIQTDIAVLKAQIHAGGRGKAGGVILVRSIDEVLTATKEILGKPLITHQTGPEGQMVNTLYLEEGCDIEKEYYLSLIVNRKKGCLTFIASSSGGMDIEEIAESTPDSILYIDIDPSIGIKAFHITRITNFLKLSKTSIEDVLYGLYKCFIDKDVSLLEINPLVLTKDAQLIALDAKMSFDDNALYRHPDIAELKDESEEYPLEIEASSSGLAYVKLEGNIGCLVNGAGLAMATMDAIYMAGGKPANFLDVGGSANAEMVSKGFEILLSDSSVNGIFVNIFGGIMQCDTIAIGIIKAAKKMNRSVPLVVRLEGTHAEQGKYLISNSEIDIVSADSMDDGADKIVKLVQSEEVKYEYMG